jgi:hypothetical protein
MTGTTTPAKTPETGPSPHRPCRYCLAAYPAVADETCQFEHRDDQRIYDLAAALAAVFQPEPLTDEKTCWFLGDADAIVDDFGPDTGQWQIGQMPDDPEFAMCFEVNGETYIVQDGDDHVTPVRLSTFRQWQQEAEET